MTELGFVATDHHTLQSRVAANVFAIGDATNLPTSKAGSATHFEGDTLVANIGRHLAGEELEGSFDGHSNCFVETGFRKALLIDFNYDVEPLPGRYPFERTSDHCHCYASLALNHLAKLALPDRLLARAAARPRHPRNQRTCVRRPSATPMREHA